MATRERGSQPGLPPQLRRLLYGLPEATDDGKHLSSWDSVRLEYPTLKLRRLPPSRINRFRIGYDGPSDSDGAASLAAYSDYDAAKRRGDMDRQAEVLLAFLKARPAEFRYSGWAESAASEILLSLKNTSPESEGKAKSFLARYWRLRRNARVESRWRKQEQLKPVIDELDGKHAKCRENLVHWIKSQFVREIFKENARYGSQVWAEWCSRYRKDPNCECPCLNYKLLGA